MRKGSPRRLDFRWDGAVLTLPVSDAYEALADKAMPIWCCICSQASAW